MIFLLLYSLVIIHSANHVPSVSLFFNVTGGFAIVAFSSCLFFYSILWPIINFFLKYFPVTITGEFSCSVCDINQNRQNLEIAGIDFKGLRKTADFLVYFWLGFGILVALISVFFLSTDGNGLNAITVAIVILFPGILGVSATFTPPLFNLFISYFGPIKISGTISHIE
ncbi:MAG: hypothetical protein LR015_00995 [Verrucomicrobia bacterium]|nr:hypothetical protein [Verrucomicrobiota bacterium]